MSGRRSQRVKLATGIYEDAVGVAICAKVYGIQHEKRTKKGAKLDDLIRFRASWIERLKAVDAKSKAHTINADFDRHISTFPPKSKRRQNAVYNLLPWRALYGEEKISTLTSIEIQRTLSKWRADGLAHSTINHRRQELSNVFTTLFGRSAANPVRDTSRFAEVHDEHRGAPQVIVRLILRKVPPGPYKLRLRVLATTGLPPAQIARLQRHDFNAKAATLFVRPRRKGAGVKGKTLPITRRAVSALRDFFDAGVQGWSHSRTQGVFRAAFQEARATWKRCRPRDPWPAPPDMVPYDLRHAFLTHAYRKTRDLRAVAELGLHADLKTTQRYAEAAVSETAARAVAMLEDAD